MNSLNFCGPSRAAVHPLHVVNSMLFDIHQQVAEQYQAYSAAAGPTVHPLTVAERLAGGSAVNTPTHHSAESVECRFEKMVSDQTESAGLKENTKPFHYDSISFCDVIYILVN